MFKLQKKIETKKNSIQSRKMKFYTKLTLLFAICCVLVHGVYSLSDDEEWDKYKKDHDKKYADNSTETNR